MYSPLTIPITRYMFNAYIYTRPASPMTPQAYSVSVVSTRPGTNSTGTVQVKVGFVPSPNTQALMDFSEIYEELVRRSRPSLVSAPPVRKPPIPPHLQKLTPSIHRPRVSVHLGRTKLAQNSKTMEASALTKARMIRMTSVKMTTCHPSLNFIFLPPLHPLLSLSKSSSHSPRGQSYRAK